ncbi:MAG: Iron complex outerrane recepter protein [Chlorobi bacterium]|nr:Iron complex outerrane recepter protein [Chlorobiota bacterium]
MRALALHISLLVLSGACAAAQPGTPEPGKGKDSARVYHAPEVRVEARSILTRVSRGTQPRAVVTRAQIEAANGFDLSDAVAYAPGVFVKQYGGVGGLRTISLRGTSAQQTVILIDGIRYRSSADGGFDFSNLPSASVDQVEVLRGGNAALYGANALGGVINVVTRAPSAGGTALTARGGYGSYGQREMGIGGNGAAGNHVWDAGFNATATNGNYPFSFNEFGATSTFERDNADFSNYFGRGGWAYHRDDGLRLSASMQGYRSERGVPGAVVQGNREQLHARLNESDLFAAAAASWPTEEWQFSISASGRLNALGYRDPDARVAGPSGIDDEYREREGNFMGRVRRAIGDHGVAEGTAEVSQTHLRGDNLDPALGSAASRTSVSGAIATNWLYDDGLFGCETALEAGLRLDLFDDLPTALSPSAGLIWRAGSTPLRLRAHGGLNYRAPSFAEQYYLNYGNANLRPERSMSGDLGATYEVGETFALESSFFMIATRDQIVSVPRSPVSWSAANVERVLSRGLELGGSGTLFDGMLGLRASYTLTRAEDRSGGTVDGKLLVYAPEELTNGIVDLRLGRYGIGAAWQYVGHRFTLPANDPGSALPRYGLLAANISARWIIGGVGVKARLECSNMFDTEYQVVRNYPMPGRTFLGRVEIDFHDGPQP